MALYVDDPRPLTKHNHTHVKSCGKYFEPKSVETKYRADVSEDLVRAVYSDLTNYCHTVLLVVHMTSRHRKETRGQGIDIVTSARHNARTYTIWRLWDDIKNAEHRN